MSLHLISVVGGRVSTLAPMLDHYLAMGVDSVLLYAHMNSKDDPTLDEIIEIAKARGITIAGKVIGDWSNTQRRILDQIVSAPKDQWFLAADQDELQEYSGNIREIILDCEACGYDYLRGCFIDRFSADGLLPEIDLERSLSDQFPIGSFFTRPILGGSPMKVVAARGGVKFTNGGHHQASIGIACPPERHFVQVNHYKWTNGLLNYLSERTRTHPDVSALKREDQRFERYLEHKGNIIDLMEPGIFSAPCSPVYPHWDTVRTLCALLDRRKKIDTILHRPWY